MRLIEILPALGLFSLQNAAWSISKREALDFNGKYSVSVPPNAQSFVIGNTLSILSNTAWSSGVLSELLSTFFAPNENNPGFSSLIMQLKSQIPGTILVNLVYVYQAFILFLYCGDQSWMELVSMKPRILHDITSWSINISCYFQRSIHIHT